MSGIDASGLKGLGKARGRLGAPPQDGNPQILSTPQPSEPSLTIPASPLSPIASEVPVTAEAEQQKPQPVPAPVGMCPLASNQTVVQPAPATGRRMDGRTLRKTNRTLQLATKVKPEFDETLRSIAMDEEILIVEVLERSLDLYRHMSAEAVRTGETPLQALQRLTGR